MKYNSLKSALAALPATGRDGFEGLLALTLARVSGNPMRLAASGFQFGVDGQGEDPTNPVCFEAKRYSSKLTREAVLTKIADLGRRKSEAEILWVLGATVAVPNQLVQDLSTDGEKQGIATLVLDWNDQELPSLGIVLANADDGIATWIMRRTKAPVRESELKRELLLLKNDEAAKLRWRSLLAEFSAKEISEKQALEANKNWLREALSSPAKARQRLGQPTAPHVADTPTLKRKTHLKAIKDGHYSETTCLVLGTEGVGKTWVAAEAALQFPGFTITLSAEALEGVKPADFEDLIFEAFCRQTMNARGKLERWRRRFLAWENAPPSKGFLVLVDGINQRPDLPWDRILSALEALIEIRGGRLLITCRPQYYQRHIQRGFNRKQRVCVSDWKPHERDKVLGVAGIDPNELDQTTLNSLLNPRLLGIAIEVLPKEDKLAWSGLTVESLLFEHINRMQSDGFEDQSPTELINALSDRAGSVLDALKANETLSSEIVFEDSLLAVKETRFFQSRRGPNGGYILKQEGLSLALGFALVDRILRTAPDTTQFDARAREIVEPIAALDQTTNVVLAAMHVCACDPEREDADLFKVLISVFCELQNLEEGVYPQFFEVVRRNPEATLNAAKEKLLEWRSSINEKWLVGCVKQMMENAQTKPYVQRAIGSWLRHVNTDALDQNSKYGRADEKDLERAEKRQVEIDEAIEAFSDCERQIFAQCYVTTGDTDALQAQSFELLAGEPLAPWATSFAAFGLGAHLDSSIYRARKAFFQLTQLNRIDPVEAAKAYTDQAVPLRERDVSKAGKWCLVKLLYASGREEDAKEALKIGRKLREELNDPERFVSHRELLCANDPCDPNSKRPSNVKGTIDEFAAIDIASIMTSMGPTSEDLNYEDRLCAVSRFGPQTAVLKASELCRQIVTREGLPLRQLALCGTTSTPLLGRETALQLSKRLQSGEGFETLPENDLDVVKLYMTVFALPHLTGDEQLELLICESLAGSYSLDAIPSFKKPSEQKVLDCLDRCAQNHLNDAAFSALSLIAHTYEELSPVLEDAIIGFIDNDLSLVRSAVFELALATENERLRTSHLQGGWKASEARTISSYENTYGSALLIAAVVSGACDFEAILPRISHESWALAQRRIGGGVTNAIVGLFDQRLRKATALSSQLDPPEIEVSMAPHDHVLHSFRSIEDRSIQVETNSQSLFRDAESDEDFRSRQKRNHRLFDEMEEAMADKDILVIAQQIDFAAFQSILESNRALGIEWLDLLLGLPLNQLRWFKDFALVVAANMMAADEAKAITLLETAIATEAFVRRMYRDGLSLEQKAIWSCPRTPGSGALWKRRFEECLNDDMLALEVLAAERFGAREFVCDYVSELISSERPIDKALAITIAGFSVQYSHFQHVLNQSEPTAGFVGEASRAAKTAQDKALWAQHWIDQMWAAETPEKFWVSLTLAAKIIDARLDYSSSIFQSANEWCKFASMFTRERKDRIRKWKRHREKTLYGSDKPDPVFLAV